MRLPQYRRLSIIYYIYNYVKFINPLSLISNIYYSVTVGWIDSRHCYSFWSENEPFKDETDIVRLYVGVCYLLGL